MEIKLPNVLYKYRDWNNTFHKRSLTETEIYFAAPIDFNDPFDCSIPFRYDEKELTPENIFKKLVIMARKINPTWTEQQIHEKAFEAQVNNLIYDEKHLEKGDQHRKKRFNEDFGVISLTTEKNNFLLWSHYSNSHTGFVIGYNTEKLFEQTKGQIRHVEYESEFPEFGLFADHEDFFSKYVYTKSKIWEYENEYRVLKDKGARKAQKLNENVLEEIILGNKMEQDIKFDLLKLIEQKYPDAIVFDSKLHNSKFELVLERIR